jgi:hypothetical protein
MLPLSALLAGKYRESGYPEVDSELPEESCQLNRSMQHHLIEVISFRGGVDETRKTVWAFCGAEDRYMAPLEGGRVVA